MRQQKTPRVALQVRLPAQAHSAMVQLAHDNWRSLNGEIVAAVERHLQTASKEQSNGKKQSKTVQIHPS